MTDGKRKEAPRAGSLVDQENRRRRAELVRDLELVKHYQRTHTPSGTHRRLPDGPPEKEVDDTDTRLRNLRSRRRKEKGP